MLRVMQEVGWYDEDRNSSGVLSSKLSADALAVKGQFGDTMGLLTQVGGGGKFELVFLVNVPYGKCQS
jgi:hypothetical protein